MPIALPSVEIPAGKEAEAALIGGGGVFGGIFVGDMIGELVKTATAQTGWTGVAVEAGTKGVLAAALFHFTKAMAGVPKVLGITGVLGVIGSIFLDVYEAWSPGGAKAAGQSAGLTVREYTRGVSQGAAAKPTGAPLQATAVTATPSGLPPVTEVNGKITEAKFAVTPRG